MRTSLSLSLLFLAALGLVGCGGDDPESDGFYLHRNGVTVLCPDVVAGATGLADGRTYTKVSELELGQENHGSLDWSFFCTSGVSAPAVSGA
jgi:hypothetical protein